MAWPADSAEAGASAHPPGWRALWPDTLSGHCRCALGGSSTRLGSV